MQEVRKWLYGFIPGTGKDAPVDFSNGPWLEDSGQTYLFAD